MPTRVRWGNVGRALGAVALVALVVAWPRLRADAPVVPGGAAVPVEREWRSAPPGAAGPAPVRERDGRARRVAPAVPGRGRIAPVRERDGRARRGAPAAPADRRTAPVKQRDGRARRGAPAAPADRRTAPVKERDEPPPRVAPSVPAPAPTIDPAELEFGFER